MTASNFLSSLDRLVKTLSKNENDFDYLSQEFDSNALDLASQKKSDFKKFKEKLPKREKFYNWNGIYLRCWHILIIIMYFKKDIGGGVFYRFKRHSTDSNK